jgi:hypothetical protein
LRHSAAIGRSVRPKVRNYAGVAQCEGSKQKDLSFFNNLATDPRFQCQRELFP